MGEGEWCGGNRKTKLLPRMMKIYEVGEIDSFVMISRSEMTERGETEGRFEVARARDTQYSTKRQIWADRELLPEVLGYPDGFDVISDDLELGARYLRVF